MVAIASSDVWLIIPTPSSMWNTASTTWRSSSWSDSGTPSSEEMTVGGTMAPKSCT